MSSTEKDDATPDVKEGGGVTIMVIPDRGESRTIQLSRSRLRVVLGGAAVAIVFFAVVGASWWYLVAKAVEGVRLEREVVVLREERKQVRAFVDQLTILEGQYDNLRSLFGSDSAGAASGVWLPPPGGRDRRPSQRQSEGRGIPNSWPLTEKGFITQTLIDSEGEHRGLDIAIPMDSYIRASGAGEVIEVGDDPVYGNFVLIEHREEYRSLYGHASLVLVRRGQKVRQNEVIALSGSSGRSTAPHLHFEILRKGEPIDPLTLVKQR